MFETAKKKLELLKDLFENIDQLVFEINSRDESKELIIYYNTEDQLFLKGEDSLGDSLGEYSDYTIELKKEKGQPFDRITTRDSMDFHDSFEVLPNLNEIVIEADAIKVDGQGNTTDLTSEFGKEIIGINDENIQLYREYVKNALLQVIHKEFLSISGLD